MRVKEEPRDRIVPWERAGYPSLWKQNPACRREPRAWGAWEGSHLAPDPGVRVWAGAGSGCAVRDGGCVQGSIAGSGSCAERGRRRVALYARPQSEPPGSPRKVTARRPRDGRGPSSFQDRGLPRRRGSRWRAALPGSRGGVQFEKGGCDGNPTGRAPPQPSEEARGSREEDPGRMRTPPSAVQGWTLLEGLDPCPEEQVRPAGHVGGAARG